MHTAGAWATLFLEVSFPFLIWHRRWRWLMICGSVCMHTFIALTMGLTAFSLLMVCMVFAFIPEETLKSALARAGDLPAPLRAGLSPNEWDHTTYISEFTVTAEDANQADATSERVLLAMDKPGYNYEAGHIAFGPDGYLYIATGDCVRDPTIMKPRRRPL